MCELQWLIPLSASQGLNILLLHKMKYRVGNLPGNVVPLMVKLYGMAGAAFGQCVLQIVRSTCRFEYHHATVRKQPQERQPAPQPHHQEHSGTLLSSHGPCLHCLWHENIPAYLAYFIVGQQHHKHVWLQHPAAYMKPVHAFLEWNNVEYVLGSSGNGGKEALQKLIHRLQQQSQQQSQPQHDQYSSAFFPDGPSGPVRKVKSGVIRVAQATKLPIVPIRFEYSPWTWRSGWDQKHLPIPCYTTIHIYEHEPIWVTGDLDETSTKAISQKLEQIL